MNHSSLKIASVLILGAFSLSSCSSGRAYSHTDDPNSLENRVDRINATLMNAQYNGYPTYAPDLCSPYSAYLQANYGQTVICTPR